MSLIQELKRRNVIRVGVGGLDRCPLVDSGFLSGFDFFLGL